MDQIKRIQQNVSVFATTNMPWELDIAALRRFEKRILVPMPNIDDRKKVLKLHAGAQHILTEQDFTYLAQKTEGYSGSDLSTLVNDALMRPIKQLQSATYFRRVEKHQILEQIDLYKSSFMFYQESEDDEVLAQSNLGKSVTSSEDGDLDMKQSYWMPINLSRLSKSAAEKVLQEQDVKRLDLP